MRSSHLREQSRSLRERRNVRQRRSLGARGTFEHAPRGRLLREFETVAGEQDGVGQEVVQIHEVGHAAGGEIVVGLRGDSGGHRGVRHQIGVGLLLTGADDERLAGRLDRSQPVLPGANAAQDAHDDEVGVGGQARDVLDQDARGIRAAVGHRRIGRPAALVGSRGRDQVGVRGREQQDHRVSSPGCRARCVSVPWVAGAVRGTGLTSGCPADADPRSQWRDRAGIAPASARSRCVQPTATTPAGRRLVG